MGAFVGAAILVLSGAGDDEEAIKRMPWRVIVMVCGVTVLIALAREGAGHRSARRRWSPGSSTPETVTGVVALLTGLISVYSSTSGVVLPAFLPMVPGLAAAAGRRQRARASPASMNVGGHLVDVSPLSTIGALCIARRRPTDEPHAVQQAARVGTVDVGRRGAALLFGVLSLSRTVG